jgi:hypothetical protein
MPAVPLKQFDMARVDDSAVCVFIGKRAAGKSFALRDLLYHHRDIPTGTVLSPADTTADFFRSFVPDICIHGTFSPALVEAVVGRQKLSAERDTAANGSTATDDPRAFLVMDGCMHDRSVLKDENVQLCFTACRHLKLLTCWTQQYPLGMPPSLRDTIDYVFLYREPLNGNRRRLYASYAGTFPTFEMFCDVMDAMTDYHECLVIHRSGRSTTIEDTEDTVFRYTAQAPPDFRMCEGATQVLE